MLNRQSNNIVSKLNQFLQNRSGNVALTTALIMLPLFAAGGAAIDYTRLAQKNSQLQGAIDAAALVGARTAIKGNEGTIKKAAEDYLKANLTADQLAELQSVNVNYDKDAMRVTVSAKAQSETSLMQIMGVSALNYEPRATVGIPDGYLEIVLVLDSTYSMSADGKMDALKVAAKDFVNDMLALNTNYDKVKIGIVPFGRYVNVGLDNRNASWLDVDADSSQTVTQTITTSSTSSNCKTVASSKDGVTTTKQECDWTTTDVDPYEHTYTQTITWSGCVGSRKYPLNLEDRSYSNKVPGLMNTSCPSRLTQLTKSKSTLVTEINNLTPNGDTYIPAGLVWGLRTISSDVPFSDGIAYSKMESDKTDKVIVLMSDGENTRSAQLPGLPTHNGTDVSEADKWTEEVCSNIKQKKIKLYTIGFGTAISSNIEDLLTKCSSDGENYLAAVSNSALKDRFEEIAGDLTRLYLSE